jgi:hypothetical protein
MQSSFRRIRLSIVSSEMRKASLGQRLQNIAIIVHDLLGQLHLPLEIRIISGRGCFTFSGFEQLPKAVVIVARSLSLVVGCLLFLTNFLLIRFA